MFVVETYVSVTLRVLSQVRMKANLEWMNVSYDVNFAAPSFDLPGKSTAVLRALYETIHPRFPISTKNMQVVGGNQLSDVHVRVTLFNGNCVIDLSVEQMSLAFNNLRSKEDVAVCRDCISLSEEALKSSLPEVTVRAVALKPTLFLELGDGEEDAANHLSRVMGTRTNLDLGGFGSAVQRPGVNLEVENSQDGWNAILHAFWDRTKVSSLILSCQAVYAADGKVSGLDSRVEHIEQLLKAFLDSIGLEMPDSNE